jgi:hypothetical protein
MGIATSGLIRAEGVRATTVQSTDLIVIQTLDPSGNGQYSPRTITAQNFANTVPLSNQRSGFATLVLGTVTIPNTTSTVNTIIMITRAGINGSTAVGSLSVSKSVGVNFIVNSYAANATLATGDVSSFYWEMIETTA